MSETTTPEVTSQASPSVDTGTTTAGSPQVFDAEYVAGLRRENAKYRTQARENAEAVKELAALKEATKTEAEKTADRMKALEEQIANTTLDALRTKIAFKHGISPEDAEVLLTGTDEESLTAQAERLVKVKPVGSSSPLAGLGSDDGKQSGEAEVRKFTRSFFNP
jgi:hypothetical protein